MYFPYRGLLTEDTNVPSQLFKSSSLSTFDAFVLFSIKNSLILIYLHFSQHPTLQPKLGLILKHRIIIHKQKWDSHFKRKQLFRPLKWTLIIRHVTEMKTQICASGKNQTEINRQLQSQTRRTFGWMKSKRMKDFQPHYECCGLLSAWALCTEMKLHWRGDSNTPSHAREIKQQIYSLCVYLFVSVKAYVCVDINIFMSALHFYTWMQIHLLIMWLYIIWKDTKSIMFTVNHDLFSYGDEFKNVFLNGLSFISGQSRH